MVRPYLHREAKPQAIHSTPAGLGMDAQVRSSGGKPTYRLPWSRSNPLQVRRSWIPPLGLLAPSSLALTPCFITSELGNL